MLTSRALGIIVSAMLVTSASAAYYSHILPAYNISSLRAPEPCNRPEDYSLVIQDGNGLNASSSHGAPSHPWPIIRVQKGETVNIIICNMDKAQSHGFAIDHYYDKGVVLGPGQVYKLSFPAKDPGKFLIYCNVFCSVHIFMIAQLLVS